MKVTALEPFGAELSEVQIAVAVAAMAASVHDPLARHRVVVFRDQRAGDADLVRFLKMLGPLMFSAGETPVAGAPDVNIVSKVGLRRPPRSVFHTDTSYVERPPAFGALRAVMLPSVGGDTLFSDQIAAAAELLHWPVAWLANRTIVHATTAADGTVEQAVHPLLQRHPAKNAATLFPSTLARCTGLSGKEPERSRRIISLLYGRSTRASRLYRHHWRKGDILIWDNRATMHLADHNNVVGDRVLHCGLVREEAPKAALEAWERTTIAC